MNSIYKISVFRRHLLILLVSVVFQLYFFDYTHFAQMFNVGFYLFFILTLPVKIKHLSLLIICVLYGVLLDLMLSSGGLFTMTTTFIGYIRPTIIRLFFVRDEHYSHTIPTSSDMGVISFIIYSFIVIFISTLFYLVVERLSFISFGKLMVDSLLSTLITLPIIFFIQLLLLGVHKRR